MTYPDGYDAYVCMVEDCPDECDWDVVRETCSTIYGEEALVNIEEREMEEEYPGVDD